jgi:hypothetical protein
MRLPSDLGATVSGRLVGEQDVRGGGVAEEGLDLAEDRRERSQEDATLRRLDDDWRAGPESEGAAELGRDDNPAARAEDRMDDRDRHDGKPTNY